MHEYPEYFDQNKKNIPYSSSSEELYDYLRLLDMVTESLLERKGLHTAKKLYSSGLVITETEVRSFYELPPKMREKDKYDPLLVEMVRAAFDYIDSRYEAGCVDENADDHHDDDNHDVDDDHDVGDHDVDDHGDGGKGSDAENLQSAGESGHLPQYRIKYIRDAFCLNRQEVFAVILALSVCIDRNYERIFGFLQDDISAKNPTAGLYFTMLKRFTDPEYMKNPFVTQLGEKLEGFFFLKQKEDGLLRPLILNPLMRRILLGTDDAKGGLCPAGSLSPAVSLYAEEGNIPVFFDSEKKLLDHELEISDERLLYLECDDRKTPLHFLYKSLTDRNESLAVLDFEEYERLAESERALTVMTLRVRERLFGDRIALFYRPDRESCVKINHRTLEEITGDETLGKIFIFGEKKEPSEFASAGVAVLNIPKPTAVKRCKIWEYFLFNDGQFKADEGLSLADLSDCYEMNFGNIMNICRQARALAKLEGTSVITRELVIEALGKQSMVNFSSLASHVNAVYGWEDLKITPDQEAVLKTACDRYRIKNRLGEKWGLKKKNAYGNGVSVLLYGPPGTGKTMAAQVVARELSLPLYRVDISRIFSKYIGETEKNLSSIFEAAKGANVILFFDEADALFSKRTEISGSNDKYSNSETAFLLQKIEEYDGMSILATNYYQNFDSAFIRRITYAVNLRSPDEEQRYELWRSILPAEAEISDDLDFRLLAAQFDLSGSNIKAILYSAAYMAGAEGAPLSMRHVAKAMQYEYQKLGRLINSNEFGPLMAYLN